MSDIFLSYAREDRQQAKVVADAIERAGWSVWWDRRIAPGKSFDQVIENEITLAKCIVVLWSNSSITSSWVRAEAEEGKNRGILIPVLLDKSILPLSFRYIQAVDLTSWDGSDRDENYQDLLLAIAALAPQADTPMRETGNVPPSSGGATVHALRGSAVLMAASGLIVGVILGTLLNAVAGAYKEGVLGSGDVLRGVNTGATQGYVSLVGAVLGATAGLARHFLRPSSPTIIVVAGGLIGASQAVLNPEGLRIISPQGVIGMIMLGLTGGVVVSWMLGRVRL